MKIEKILEVRATSKANNYSEPGQYTHLYDFDVNNKNWAQLPKINGFMIIVPQGTAGIGQKFKVTLESID